MARTTENIDIARPCPVCPRKDRDWIEVLMAGGVYYGDIRLEFGISENDLRRHEALHSTKQPSVDPLTILREMRWLNEQSHKTSRREISTTNPKISEKVINRRFRAITSRLAVLKEYSVLINAPKHLDDRVVLPRWHQVIMNLSERLKDIPGAIDALTEWAKEQGPQNTGIMVKTNETIQQIEDERAKPTFTYEHNDHECPQCTRVYRCYRDKKTCLGNHRFQLCKGCIKDNKNVTARKCLSELVEMNVELKGESLEHN